LPIPTSGVTVIGKKPIPRPVASMPLKLASAEKPGSNGDEKFGWLKKLKISARNCSLTRSVIFVVLKTEKSNEQLAACKALAKHTQCDLLKRLV
jgi:hypothetical protein